VGDLARLLGRPTVTVEGDTYELPAGRRGAVWLFVVHQHRWVDRDELTFLLWPDHPQGRANANVRQVLTAVARSPWGRCLERTRGCVRCLLDTDVAAFEVAAREQRDEDALEWYGGAFLNGFVIDDAPEFMRWLEFERAALHDRWRTIAVHAIDRWIGSQCYDDALRLGERLLGHDPLDDDAAWGAMLAADATGQPRRALLIFEALRTELQRELHLEPSPRTAELARRIAKRAEPRRATAVTLPEAPRVHEASFASRFVGRERELEELAALVTTSAARLVTLVAPGGMGKTWLARALGSRVSAAFASGAVFVALEDVSGPQALCHAIANALGARLGPKGALQRQLAAVIAERELLLVLDGFDEHVKEHALLTTLLDECPRVRLLVTSRVRLQHSEESPYELAGLDVTTPVGLDAVAPASLSDAARLFLRAACRVMGPGRADALDTEHVDAICRSVGGSPLALDLTASWLAVAPIASVRDRVASSWDVLHSDDVDRPARHHDMHALIEETHQRLADHDRRTWARLALLRGSFDHETAVRVSGTSWRDLLRLKRYALLRSVGDRLQMHALVARFGRDLAERTGESERVGAELAQLFSERLDPESREAPLVSHDDLPHLEAAWHHGLRSASFDRLAAMAVGLQRSFHAAARNAESRALCDEAVEALMPTRGADRDKALARVICGASSRFGPPPQRARTAIALGEAVGDPLGQAVGHASLALGEPMPSARHHHRRSRALFDHEGHASGVIYTCLTFGARLAVRGHHAEATAAFEEALERALTTGSEIDEAEALAGLADVARRTGDLETAEARAIAARERFERLGVPVRAATCVATLAWVARLRGDLDEATRWGHAYLEYQDAMGLGDGIEARVARMYLEFALGRYDDAYRTGSGILAAIGRASTGYVADITRLRLARIAVRRGDATEARDLIRAVLRPRQASDGPTHARDAVVAAAELAAAQGRGDEALALLRQVLAQPALDSETRLEVAGLADAQNWHITPPDPEAQTSLTELVALAHATLDRAS
jgi:DNA-binding SARP family transcriptional activator/predicted ATPase/tetratricopeptide (TPR) repeat protein